MLFHQFGYGFFHANKASLASLPNSSAVSAANPVLAMKIPLPVGSLMSHSCRIHVADLYHFFDSEKGFSGARKRIFPAVREQRSDRSNGARVRSPRSRSRARRATRGGGNAPAARLRQRRSG